MTAYVLSTEPVAIKGLAPGDYRLQNQTQKLAYCQPGKSKPAEVNGRHIGLIVPGNDGKYFPEQKAHCPDGVLWIWGVQSGGIVWIDPLPGHSPKS